MVFTNILGSTLLAFLFGVLGFNLPDAKKNDCPYLQYVDEISESVISEVGKKWNLHYCGGGGIMPEDVEEIAIGFQSSKITDLAQARVLHVVLTEKLVKKMNTHEVIRPFLRNYPSDHRNTNIRLSFPQSEYADHSGEVHFAFQAHGDIIYYTDMYKESEIKVKEPYEEALEIVRKEHPELGL